MVKIVKLREDKLCRLYVLSFNKVASFYIFPQKNLEDFRISDKVFRSGGCKIGTELHLFKCTRF